jgi:DNA-binding NarL/FixJ family response regulator
MVDKVRVDRIVADRRTAIEGDVCRVRELFPRTHEERNCSTLCPAEVHVLRLVGMGLTNEEIAEVMSITINTVRTYTKRLHDKCEIEGRSRLAIVAMKAEIRRSKTWP